MTAALAVTGGLTNTCLMPAPDTRRHDGTSGFDGRAVVTHHPWGESGSGGVGLQDADAPCTEQEGER